MAWDERPGGDAHRFAASGIDHRDRGAIVLLEHARDPLPVRRPRRLLGAASGSVSSLRSDPSRLILTSAQLPVRCCSAKTRLDPSGDHAAFTCWSAVARQPLGGRPPDARTVKRSQFVGAQLPFEDDRLAVGRPRRRIVELAGSAQPALGAGSRVDHVDPRCRAARRRSPGRRATTSGGTGASRASAPRAWRSRPRSRGRGARSPLGAPGLKAIPPRGGPSQVARELVVALRHLVEERPATSMA